ncbi:MAG: YggT family protein [Chloroflexota bacterium]
MDYIIGAVVAILEIFKWLILANVILAFLPMISRLIPGYHPAKDFINRVRTHPAADFIRKIVEPVLRPIRPYCQFGMIDFSPLVVFFLIGFLQDLLVGGIFAVTRLLARIIVLVTAFSIHEFAHAYVAFQQGDPTAKHQGRLTLHPRSHLDIFGSLALLAFGFGWAKPVPVNPNYLRSGPKIGMAIVAIAGPISNLILAGLGAVVIRTLFPLLPDANLLSLTGSLVFFVQLILIEFVGINVLLFFFNLLPIAPLDGFKVLVGFLPYPQSSSFQRLEPIGPIILLVLLLIGQPLLALFVGLPSSAVTSLLLPSL